MTAAPTLPEADCIEGAPHPRMASRLFGHAAAEAAFAEAFHAGRLHHGWLIGGPRGVGKATLAWRMARFLLAQPGETARSGLFPQRGAQDHAGRPLDIAENHPASLRLRAGAHPGLLLVRRGADERNTRLRPVITVDEMRRLHGFFGTHATDGGWRVVIVDAADEMNANAANALLKALEEPPARAVLLLVAHQPSALLPTIRSRCRYLPLGPLAPQEMADALAQAGFDPGADTAALAELAGGSAGTAIRLLAGQGLALYGELVALYGAAPQIDRARLLKLAQSVSTRGTEDRFDLVLALTELWLARLARTGAGAPPGTEAAPGEHAALARLAPDPAAARSWAEAQVSLLAQARQGRAVNLDAAALVIDMMLGIEDTARNIL